MTSKLVTTSIKNTSRFFLHPQHILASSCRQRQSISLVQHRWRTSTSSTTLVPDEQHICLEHVACDNNSVVSILTLNRPKANAMGSVMLQQLQDSIENLESSKSDDASETRCVVLTSYSPKVFSAGADLKERATMTQVEASAFVTSLRNTLDRVARLPFPVVAAIEGVAVGGGLELALAADIRIAGQNAVMGLPETSLAIIPGAGGTQRLPRLIGAARAKELIFTGRRIDATTAAEYGLVQHVVDAGKAEDKALEIAKQIAKNGPLAIRAAKSAIDEGLEADNMANALFVERHHYQRIVPTSDRLEGLAAFREGRTPVYKGE